MFQLMEAPEYIDICAHFSTAELAQRFLVFLDKDRPEFEDEVEPEFLAWFELLNDWPYPEKQEARETDVCMSWAHSWLTIDDVVKLNTLVGVTLVAVWLIEKGVEHGDEGEYEELGIENPMYGYYYRLITGEITRMPVDDRELNTGYVLKYSDASCPFEDLWALRDDYIVKISV